MLSFGPEKILVVLVLAMILLGPDKLPSMARQLGAAVRAFREFQHKVETEVRNTVPDLPSSADIARFTRSPGAFLSSLADMDLGQDPVPDPGATAAANDGAWPSDPGAPTAISHAADGPAAGPPGPGVAEHPVASNGASANGHVPSSPTPAPPGPNAGPASPVGHDPSMN